jgi:transglutaminase-like putative cysteine protease
VVVSARREAIAAVRNEGSYPNWYFPFPFLQLAPERTWADVVGWALPLYPDPGPLPAELEARLVEWNKIADPAARAFAVLRTVQRDVRYFGTELGENTHRPALPGVTWERRYGDCKDKAFLTATLLRRLGIEAEPALVSLHRGKGLQQLLSSGADFDHVIVRARIAGTSFWLDATLAEQHGSLAANDVHDYGVALPVRAGVDALVPVPRRAGPATR